MAAGLNGYMATLTNLKNPVNKWRCGAAPIPVSLLQDFGGKSRFFGLLITLIFELLIVYALYKAFFTFGAFVECRL